MANADPVNDNNHLPQLTAARAAPSTVAITDVTLREGEQAEGVRFSLETKVELALELERAGVRQVQVGYPGRFPKDAEATHEVAAALSSASVEAVALTFVPDWEHEVQACIASGAQVLSVVSRASDRLHRVLDISREDVLATARSAVERAARAGLTVAFVPSDSTRADPAFLYELWQTAADAGASRIYVADSMGAATPELIAFLVACARTATGLSIGVHCHNDFGLAVANTLAGVNAGAELCDTAVNGLGDRAGNAAFEEVAVALELLYKIDTSIDLAQLTSLSRRFAEAAGRPLPLNKPISGKSVFTHVLPTHVSAMEIDPRAIQPFEAETVGNAQRLGLRHAE